MGRLTELVDGVIKNAFNGGPLKTDTAKTKIVSAIKSKLDKLEKVESQWEPKNLGCLCKDKYAKMTHIYDAENIKFLDGQKIKDFAQGSVGKIYQVDGEYVRASCGGVKIEEIDEDESCYALLDTQNSRLGTIQGPKEIPQPPAGLFTAQLRWHETSVEMQMSNGLMSESVSGCGMAALGSGGLTLEDVYPGVYPVNVTADGYQDLNDSTLFDTLTLDIKAVNVSKYSTFTVTRAYHYPNLGSRGHVADIIVTQPEDPEEPPLFETVSHYSGYIRSGGGYSGSGSSSGGLCEYKGNCGCLPCQYSIIAYLNQTRLGPISGAKVILYKATQEDDINREILYKGYTVTSNEIDKAGVITLPVPYLQQTTFSDEEQTLMDKIAGYEGDFILEVSGGFDIDRDDDFNVDSNFTQMNGKLHMILSKENLLDNDYKVNILTEISYQVSKDLLGKNYDKVRLQKRLDDIAKRVLIEKLYYGSEETLGRNDIFYWIPSVHKNWLMKPYDSALAPIVNKVYIGENIADDAYHYVYDIPISRTIPLLTRQDIKVDENVSNGTMIGNIDVVSEGNSSIIYYHLKGEGNETFRIENNGSIYLLEDKTLDYEEKSLYDMKLIAVNSSGESRPVTFYIIIGNIIDAPEDRGFKGGVISENASSGDIAGVMHFDQGAAPIERIELEGEDKASFRIDINGTIVVSNEASFDYEMSRTAKITVQAFNSYGGSRVVAITFLITDAVDIPIVQMLDVHLEENATVNQEVGKVTILSNDPLLEVNLIGSGSENFTIDLNGTISVAEGAVIDYETRANYALQVEARNIQGVSRLGTVVIRIDNVPDVPQLKQTVLHVIEQSPIGTIVGNIIVDNNGNSPILSFRLSGNGSENFNIDNQGTVTIANDTLNRNNRALFNLNVSATNSEGESLFSEVLIYIDTQRPVLDSLDSSVYEGASAGTLIGTVPLINSATPINAIRLEGMNHEKFTIDLDRNIKVSEDVDIDYEVDQNYILSVVATNSMGESDATAVYIRVIDVDDTIRIKGFSTTIYNDTPIDSIIGIASILSLGGHTVNHFELSGEGSENFSVDSSGIVKVIQNESFEHNTFLYHLALVALDENNIKSNEVYLDISVVQNKSSLQISDLWLEVKENVTVGTIIGVLDIHNEGTSPIESIVLEGRGADSFSVSNDGVIRLLKTLDYENRKIYYLNVVAVNDPVSSEPGDLTIEIINIPDIPPLLQATRITIEENTMVDTVVGKISVIDKGDSNITSFILSGKGSENFIVDATGTIKVGSSATLDYETISKYVFGAVAINDAGNSTEVTVTIDVTNVVESVPVLATPTNSNIDEDAIVETIVSAVYTNGSNIDENTVNSYTIVSGNTNNAFIINSSGVIKTATKLEYKTVPSYRLRIIASNIAGESVPIDLVVNVQKRLLKPFQIAKKVASDGGRDDTLGTSVAISGNLMIVGVPYEDTKVEYNGAAYLFEKDANGSVRELKKLIASDGKDLGYFGTSVAMSGNLIVIGAPNKDGKGAVYLFEKDVNGDVFELEKLTASDGENSDKFGNSVAISGDLIIVGAPYEDEKDSNAGAAYIFEKDINGNVVELGKLTISDGKAYDKFGSAVAISGDLIIVGEPYGDGEVSNAGAAYVFKKDENDSVRELKKLTASDGKSSDKFGTSVAMSGSLIVIGAPNKDGKGAAYVFEKDINGNVVELGKLTISDGKADDQFGTFVNIDTDLIVVGAPYEDEKGSNAGAVYFFEKDTNGSINGVGKVTASDGKNTYGFGYSVAVSDDLIVVGAESAMYLFDLNPLDRVYIYGDSHIWINLNEEVDSGDLHTIKAASPSGSLTYMLDTIDGISFAMHDNNFSLPVPLDFEDPHDDNGDNIYQTSITIEDTRGHQSYMLIDVNISDINTLEIAKKVASDGENGDYFGSSVAISGNLIVIGAWNEDEKGSNSGAVYVFEKDVNGNVVELGKLTASDGEADDYFGSAIAISGDLIVVGAGSEDEKGSNAGAAYVFEKDVNGNVVELGKLTASDGEAYDYFGQNVAISGELIVVGVPYEDGEVSNAGAAYVFQKDVNGSVRELKKLTASDGEAYDYFGSSVAISGNLIVVGAAYGDEKGFNDGAAYVFEKDTNGNVKELRKRTASDGEADDYFGSSVAISGDIIVVGAPYEDEKGAVYIYDKIPGL